MQRSIAIPSGEIRLYETAMRTLIEGIVCDPTSGRFDCSRKLPTIQLHRREMVIYSAHAPVPDFTLELYPVIEIGRVVEVKALQETSSIDRDSILELHEHVPAFVFLQHPSCIGCASPRKGHLNSP